MSIIVLGGLAFVAWNTFAQQDQPLKVEEVSGMITGTDRKGDEFSLRLRSLTKTYTVQVGSLEFLKKQNMELDTGQLITVKGTISGDTIVAHEIKKGDQVVVLRNEKGEPQFAGEAPVDVNRVTLKGKITKLEKSADHLIATIQTESNESIRVDLGSDAFLNERSIHVAEGGTLQVQAYRTVSGEMPLYIATEIHHEGTVVALQDELHNVVPLGPWVIDSEYNKLFKADQLTQVNGTILDIVRFTLAADAPQGVALILSAPQGQITCHLGPIWYIQHQGMAFKKGDSITCSGSMVNFQGQNVLVVSQLSRGNESLMIRDPQGMPCYAAYRKVGQ